MHEHDLVVIGAGPGGYVAALRAAQLGMNVAVVEKEPLLGGTCLRVGCIPSKSLLVSSHLYDLAQHHLKDHGIVVGSVSLDLAAMQARKRKIVTGLGQGVAELLKKAKVTRYEGQARFVGADRIAVEHTSATTEVRFKNCVIATGSKPASLPGVAFDGDRIGSSTEALEYGEVPKDLVVIGAGAIGLELGSVWSRLGATVTVLEYLDRILPEMDAEIATAALRAFKKQGLVFRLGSRVTEARVEKGRVIVQCAGAEPISAERVLVAVGRTPNTEGLGLDVLGIQVDKRGRIPVDRNFGTTAPGVYAIGDVIAGPMLAHKAEEEGIAVAEFLSTGYGHVNELAIPSVVYTHPEVAAVGKTEQQLEAEGIHPRKGVFPLRANARARVLGEIDGMAKILAHPTTDRILGVHVLGPNAGELIAEAAAAIAFGASSEDLARTCHAHPTLSEIVREAAFAVDHRALHS